MDLLTKPISVSWFQCNFEKTGLIRMYTYSVYDLQLWLLFNQAVVAAVFVSDAAASSLTGG